MKKKYFELILMLSFFSTSVPAQVKTDSIALSLSEIEVSAASHKLYSQMGRVVAVIDRKEIDRLAVHSIDQLLEYVAGIDIRQRGTNGTQADISIRGGSFDQVLVLLNGVNITDPQTGHFNLDIPINWSDISKVEILEGSSARVLGPSAFSGAINIVTHPFGEKSLQAELSSGSFHYFDQSATANTKIGNALILASVSHKSSNGYRENTDFDQRNVFVQSVFKTLLSGKLDIQAAAQWKDFGANGFYSLAFPNQYESSKIFMAALNWSLTKDHFTINSQAYWREHHDRFELFRDMTGAPNWYTGHNYHLTDVTGAKASIQYSENFGKSTAGIEVRNEHIFSNVLGNPMFKTIPVPFENGQFFSREADRLLETAFFDQVINLDKWYFSAGIAASNSSSFGLYSYGGIDAGYALNENIRFVANENSAVRLPTFTDLYYKSATQLANPNLKPEHAQTFEIGLKMAFPAWKLNADIFKRFGQQVIDWVKEPDSTKWQSKNLTSVNAIGTDFAFEYRFKKSIINKISANYAFLNLDKTAQGFDSKYALDYLKHKITITLEHKIAAHLSAAWSGIYAVREGQYADFTTNQPVSYQPYFLFNGRIKWEQNQMEIFVDLNNLFNEKYADFGGLIQPGTEFNITLRVKIGKQGQN